ncbi:hypothetical protein ALC53_04110 [Atta colombica]|uniref:Uncharacterized protein n=1 Tax=Atta colombica TaxID=520822 RepID=A0A195BMD4_9HYME|nr:hypothetical protein ALC53_04110 [Atta colombica]
MPLPKRRCNGKRRRQESRERAPPLLSINHPRLNGRFMQILILHDCAAIPIIFLATDLQIRVSMLPAIEILTMLRIIHAYIIAHKT